MSAKNQLIFWSFAVILLIGFIAVFKAILLPFVLGAAIAYFLNPTVEKLGRIKIKRHWASLIILGVFSIVVVGLLGAITPVLYKEMQGLSADLPSLIEKLALKVEPYLGEVRSWLGAQNPDDVKGFVSSHIKGAAGVAGGLAKGLAAGGTAVFDFVSLLVITPIMAYFMMTEWPHITETVKDLIPKRNKKTIMDLFKEIDKKISSFVRGQISVALILAVGYALALSIAGLKYGFLIGIMAGLLSIIPMVGSILGLVVSVAVAWFQTGEVSYMFIIAAIFIAGQVIEGYILTPKLVGESVGLHPLWVFFSLMAGGSLFGIVGMLLAIPVAAIASVLVAFAIHQYKQSVYYEEKKKASKSAAKSSEKS